MTEQHYTYAVARIRFQELSLLKSQDFNQLLSAKSYQNCVELLFDRGFGKKEAEEAIDIISNEREKTWDFIRQLVKDMTLFDVFLYEFDFHNVKAAIKQNYTSRSVPGIYIRYGSVPVDVIVEAINQHEFSLLPEFMREAAKEAFEVLLHTGDGQLCDVILDKATLETIFQAGKHAKDKVLSLYAEFKVAMANIKIAIRGCRTKKGSAFFERALAACDTIDIQQLMKAMDGGENAVFEYLNGTQYADAVQEIKKSLFAFELWCDNHLIEMIKPQKYNPFTSSPIAAFILAKESELKSVRIILSGKKNSLSESSIRERVRESYV